VDACEAVGGKLAALLGAILHRLAKGDDSTPPLVPGES
jgi:hypothetical protein